MRARVVVVVVLFTAIGSLKNVFKLKQKKYDIVWILLGSANLEVRISPASNSFEIGNGDQLAINGKVRLLNTSGFDNNFILPEESDQQDIIMDKNDVYKELRLRGYEYGPDFQTVLGLKDKGLYSKYNYIIPSKRKNKTRA